jgi:hypothetical protein
MLTSSRWHNNLYVPPAVSNYWKRGSPLDASLIIEGFVLLIKKIDHVRIQWSLPSRKERI